jgi:murein DD-endopeptidase MepM/ murein hydrolase activator NlpD
MRRLVFFCAFLGAGCNAPEAPRNLPPPPVAAQPAPARLEPTRSFEVRTGRVRRDETIVGALARTGVDATVAGEIVASLQGVFDFRKARPGDELRVTTEAGTVQRFDYRRGPVEAYVARRENGRLQGSAVEFRVEKQVARVAATLDRSLYEALQAAGEDPQLALAFADVLAWDVDFYNDPRKGDTVQLVVEKYLHDGQLVRYGDILAASYQGEVTGKKAVFRFPDPTTGTPEYYAEDGSAARRAFLKSPLKFAHVTSGFGLRYHPVLQYLKAHQGVDFGAAPGTPVWAVGDGTVAQAGWAGPCGNMVTLRHANGLSTIYCHLSRIDVHTGERVAQKKVIGWSGATGRVTGPHLHYAVKRGGQFVNPLALKFPPSAPLPASALPSFRAAIAPLESLLLDTRLAAAATPPPAGP